MMNPLVQTGGARLGIFNATWPFAKLHATSDVLRLSCLGSRYSFPKSEIRRLCRHQGFISTGLRIEHSNPAIPEFVVFWTFAFQELRAGLEALGYVVQD